MGQIFGFSDLPVTIFTTPFEQIKVIDPAKIKLSEKIFTNTANPRDTFVSQKKYAKSGFFNRLANGFKNTIKK